MAEIDSKEQPLPKPSAALQEVFGATFELAEILEVAIVSIAMVSIAIVSIAILKYSHSKYSHSKYSRSK